MSIRYVPDEESSASDWFYPQRQRCLACHRYFAWLVIKRLWCSYECAEMQPPSRDPADWPRHHRTGGSVPREKTGYTHPEVVDAARHKRETIHLYPCDYCGMYHLGHRRVNIDGVFVDT
jgi:hypothetical protein